MNHDTPNLFAADTPAPPVVPPAPTFAKGELRTQIDAIVAESEGKQT